MFEDVGEYTLYEYEAIDLPKDVKHAFSPPSPASFDASYFRVPTFPSPTSPWPASPSSPPDSPVFSHQRAPPARSPHGRGPLDARDFRPLRVLGRGGHGTVYLAADAARAGRRVALKVVAKSGLRTREYPAVFGEQAVARALTVGAREGGGGRAEKRRGRRSADGGGGAGWFVPLLGSFEDSDNFYFVMEYYPRGDLMQWMRRFGMVPEYQARLWCAELLVALEHLHARRIVHRDVKPDNLLIDADGHLALADFGIARDFARPARHAHGLGLGLGVGDDVPRANERDAETTHTLVGTPGYTAPEVYSGTYSYAVDVWGAGVVLYCMLAGRLPFGLRPKEQGLDEIISRTDAYPVEYGLSGDVHPEARDILKQMLEKDPEKRPSIRKLKKHEWFCGINWDFIELRAPSPFLDGPQVIVETAEDDVEIPCGRPYTALEDAPHPWFAWTSPDLRGGDGAWESSWDAEGGTVNVDGEGLGKLPGVMRKMKGWLRRRKARV